MCLGSHLSVDENLLTNSRNSLLGVTCPVLFATRSRYRASRSGSKTTSLKFTVDTASFAFEKSGINVRLKTRMSIRFVSSLEYSPFFADYSGSWTSPLNIEVSENCLASNGASSITDCQCFF